MASKQSGFFLDSGSLALDLLNTQGRSGDRTGDLVHRPAALLDWLEATGLVDAGSLERLRSPPRARLLLTEALRLRGDIAVLVGSLQTGAAVPPHVLYGLNRILGASRVKTWLRVDEGSAEIMDIEAGESLTTPLAPVARAAAEMVVEADPKRIRQCASASCGRWFLDTSKGGRRRWCSMAACGNRAKAASHRERAIAS